MKIKIRFVFVLTALFLTLGCVSKKI